MKTLLCTLVLATLGAATAKADPLTTVTITFDQPDMTILPGQTIEVFGTITNDSGQAISLNFDDPTLVSDDLTLTDQFFNTLPPSLAPSGQPNSSSGDIELFDITAASPLNDAPATYFGSYQLFGGADGGDGSGADFLGEGDFSVTTEAATSPVPEPSSLYLMLAGLSIALFPISKSLRART
jgi:PEP-CTERM motif